MSSGSGVDQGKGTFVREFFASNPDANEESVNEAWSSEGREGTISVSLISKIKAELGLTNRRRGAGRPKAEVAGKTRGRPRKSSKVALHATHQGNGEQASAGRVASSSHGGDILDELEEDLDDLIQKIKDIGEMPDVVKALRRARRLLVRSHEG